MRPRMSTYLDNKVFLREDKNKALNESKTLLSEDSTKTQNVSWHAFKDLKNFKEAVDGSLATWEITTLMNEFKITPRAWSGKFFT